MNGNSTFTWFKLPTALITQPKFQRLSPIAQAGFVTLCCVYWQDSGVMTYDDAQMNAEGVDELIDKGYIQAEEGMISIAFLDEQIEEVEQLRAKKKEAGVKSAEARAKKKASTSSTPVQHVFNGRLTDKNRIEEIEEIDEKRKIEEIEESEVAIAPAPEQFDSDGEPMNLPQKKQSGAARFIPPTLQECELYFQAQGYPQEASKFFNYYDSNGWRVGKNRMQKWKSAAAGWISRSNDYIKPQNNGNSSNTASIATSIANQIANGDWDITKG